ncbi:MAG: hypothetical protein FJZ01_14830 [Candidatus Sericytochromatia bacterium]|nr:hypothetical protein [Candidatus Tanganyikabacteria bacterium]
MKMLEGLEALPEAEIAAVERFIAFIRWQHDPVSAALDAAPLDDEPEDEEERQAVAEAEAEFARGEGVPHAEALRRLGLDRAS